MLLPAGSTQLAAWAVTYLLPRHASANGTTLDPSSAHSRQIDREGNPLVKTLLISQPAEGRFQFRSAEERCAELRAPTIAGNLIRFRERTRRVFFPSGHGPIPDTLNFDTTLPDGCINVPPNGRQLSDRVDDFLLTLMFNVQGNGPGFFHPAAVTCPGIAQTGFSDCTAPKQFLSVFPFLGPPLQITP